MFRRMSTVVLLLGLAAAAGANVPDLQDPTRPLKAAPVAAGHGVPGKASPRPTLQSVLIGPRRRVAVIDGYRMTEGQERRGLKVWKIRSDGVVVSVDGSPRMTLKLTNTRMHKELR